MFEYAIKLIVKSPTLERINQNNTLAILDLHGLYPLIDINNL